VYCDMLYRIPIFLHRKSNHIFTVWQHMVLLVMIRQYEGKRSYRLCVDWLVEEAYYLRMNRSPFITTYTTFHYSSEIHGKNQWNPARKDNFIIHNCYKNRTIIRWNRFVWLQSNPCFTVLYRKSKTYEKKKIHQTITDS
jgi:hypothetical protein